MEQLLTVREVVIKFYKKYEAFILPVLRFILGYMVFSLIGNIGYSMEAFDIITRPSVRFPYNMLMALLFTILPIGASYALMAFNIVVQFSINYEVAAIVGCTLLLILFFYGRLGGREKWLILFTVLGFYFKIPYIVPLIAGLYFGIQSVIPISIGVFLWEFYPLAFNLVNLERPKAASILDIPESFGQVFSYFTEAIQSNDRWIVTAFVFALVVLVVFAASKIDVDYAKEIAIAMGTVVNLISFIFLKLAINYDVSIGNLFFLSLFSGFVVLVVKFFDIALNYQRTERVEFEDDDNYYYVKVVPKISVVRKERSIRQIKDSRPVKEPSARRGSRRVAADTYDDDNEYDDYVYPDSHERRHDDGGYGVGDSLYESSDDGVDALYGGETDYGVDALYDDSDDGNGKAGN